MKFQIGDRVEVTDIGNSYTSYKEMAEWVHLPNYQFECAVYHTIYTVVGMKIHEHIPGVVVGIVDNNNRGYLVGERGLQLASSFREGDVIQIDGDTLTVDKSIPFDESQAVLVSRKNLI